MSGVAQAAPRATTIGMGLFLLSEATFFAVLFLMYFWARASAPPVEMAAASRLDPVRAGLFTVALLGSSVTVLLAERSSQAGNRSGQRLWLAATVLLGALFLVGQAGEYAGLVRQGISISSSVFGTYFFTLTGLHFLHVSAGVLLLAILTYLAWWGRPGEPGRGAFEPVAYYWHFVDLVWIGLFVVLYLVRP